VFVFSQSLRPHLYRVTKPYYDFLGVTAKPITDGMLIPWEADEIQGTIWAVSHTSEEALRTPPEPGPGPSALTT
jgi:hypothetical protein